MAGVQLTWEREIVRGAREVTDYSVESLILPFTPNEVGSCGGF